MNLFTREYCMNFFHHLALLNPKTVWLNDKRWELYGGEDNANASKAQLKS